MHRGIFVALTVAASACILPIDVGWNDAPTTTTGTAGSGGALLCVPEATKPCYDGPEGTDGQGTCRAGTQVCATDGASWGACAGQVLPKVEDCATAADEDCDGTTPPCAGTLLWAKAFGDPGTQWVTGIAADAAGNVIVTGYFFGTVDFGGGALTSQGGADIFVAKLAAGSGAHLWSKRWGDAGSQSGKSISVDPTGRLILAGDFSGSVDFGGGVLTSAGGSDVFVAELSGASGDVVWSRQFGGFGDQYATGVIADATGHVALVGYFDGAIDFGTGALSSTGITDAYVAKLDATGSPLWSRSYGAPGAFIDGRSVTADATGGAWITGGFSEAVDFGGGSLSPLGTSDAYVLELDSQGGHVSSTAFGTPLAMTDAWSIAVDASGDGITTGGFSGAVDFGAGVLTSTGMLDVFVARAGTSPLARAFGGGHGADVANGKALAVDADGNVIVTGDFVGELSIGKDLLLSAGDGDVFLAKLTNGGAPVWSKRFGDSAGQNATAIVADADRNVVIAGAFSGSIAFDASLLVSAGGTDIFIAKFAP